MKSKILLLCAACLVAGILIGLALQRDFPTKPALVPPRAAAPASNQMAVITAATVAAEIARLAEQCSFTDGRSFMEFSTRITQLVSSMPADALPGAAQAALRLPEAKQNYVLSPVMSRWVPYDLEAARKFALQSASGQRKNAVRALLNAWSATSIEPAAAWVDTVQDREALDAALPILVQRLSSTQPARAFGYWQKLSAGEQRSWSTTLFRAWSEKNPAAAISNMLQVPLGEYESRSLFSTALQNWAAQDAAATVAWLQQLPDGTRRRELIRAVAPTLGRNQPQTGAALIQSLPAGDDRLSALRQLAEGWSSQNTMAAFQWARDLPDGADRQAALEATLDKVGQVKPEVLRDFISREPGNPAVANHASSLARQLAGTNAAGVLDWAKTLPPGNTRERVLAAGIGGLEELQPARAAALACEVLTGETRRNTLRGVFSRWAENDPQAASAAAMTLPSVSDRDDVMESVAYRWVAHSAADAINWVLSLESGVDRRKAERAIINGLEQEHPAKAAAFAAQLAPSEHTAEMTETIIGRWANMDIAAADAWLAKQPDDLRRRYGYRKLAQVTLKTDIKRAADYALLGPADDGYNSVREQVASQWAEIDPKSAAQWYLTNSSPGTRSTYTFNTVFSKWGRKAPKEAVEFALALPKDSRLLDRSRTLAELLRSPVYDWAKEDPETAMNWLANKATPELRTALSSSVLHQWATHDAKAMRAWLETQPAGEARDKFVSSAISTLSYERPESGATLLHLISDDKKRQTSAETVARQWLRRDAVAAEQWLKTNSLPAAIKDRVRKRRN